MVLGRRERATDVVTASQIDNVRYARLSMICLVNSVQATLEIEVDDANRLLRAERLHRQAGALKLTKPDRSGANLA